MHSHLYDRTINKIINKSSLIRETSISLKRCLTMSQVFDRDDLHYDKTGSGILV